MKRDSLSLGYRLFLLYWIGLLFLAACVVPSATATQSVLLAPDTVATSITNTTLTSTAVDLQTPGRATSTPQIVKITIASHSASTRTIVRVITTATPSPTVGIPPSSTATSEVEMAVEPTISKRIAGNPACGHIDIVTDDGHFLQATPRILSDKSNIYEQLPKGSRIDIIDCRLWVDREMVPWLPVRTQQGKLGWVLVQPDKLYAIVYPIAHKPSDVPTSVAPGSTVGYSPSAECKTEAASGEVVATSIGVDFIPIVGDAKGVVEAATGCDMITGERLGNWRWLGLLGVVGLAEFSSLRHADDVTDGMRLANNVDNGLRHGDEVAESIGRNTDTVADILQGTGKIDNTLNAGDDAVRVLDNRVISSNEMVELLSKFEQPCSFSADTLVTTPNGLKPISQVKPGNRVLAYHETLKTVDYYTVTDSFHHLDPVTIWLTIDHEAIETTPEHPFYVAGQWIPARAIVIGDRIRATTGGAGQVQAITVETQPQVMYNLTVAEAHTYFVGAAGWLVHNACSRKLRSNLQGSLDSWTDEVAWQAHHIIPGQLEEHPFVIRATDGNWKIDGADNGIALPVAEIDGKDLNLPTHRGPHGKYISEIERELDSLEERALREQWSEQRAAQELNKLVQRKREEILGLAPGERIN